MKAEYAHSKVGCVSFWCLSSECSAIQACTMARKQFDQGAITQRLTPFGPLATHQKNKGTLTISRALLHHIGTDSLQRFRFKQVNNTLHTRFCASTLWMICPLSDNHPFSSIL